MIKIKTEKEIEILREGGKKLAFVLSEVAKIAKPGVVTIELDELAEKLIREGGGEPSFKNYRTGDDRIPFPASLCVSINDEIVHGIPSKKRVLKEGDIVSLDAGMKYKGMYTDSCITVPVGDVNDKARRLMDVCKKALSVGIKTIKEGSYIGDIGFAIQTYAEKEGFGVVRNLVGHGVGYEVHEGPEIPNFGKKGEREKLKAGMVLAIEPMLTEGSYDTKLASDDWTWKTRDGKLSAQFEHTVVVTKNGFEILTK
jgi:methionyl aminopeptidase